MPPASARAARRRAGRPAHHRRPRTCRLRRVAPSRSAVHAHRLRPQRPGRRPRPQPRADPPGLGAQRGRRRQDRAADVVRRVGPHARCARPVLCRPRNVRRGARYDRKREPVALPATRTRDPPGLLTGCAATSSTTPTGATVTSLPPQPLSPLDGRYRAAVGELGEFLSEAGLNRARVEVEVEWLIALTDRSLFGTSPLSDDDKTKLRALYLDFGQAEIHWLADKEAVTRHDVKAVEYLVRDRLSSLGLDAVAELTHFACTSEDINSTSYALTVRRAVERVWLPKLREVTATLSALAVKHRDAAMLSRTHGQPATPSTMGKELAVFAWRPHRVADQVEGGEYLAQF